MTTSLNEDGLESAKPDLQSVFNEAFLRTSGAASSSGAFATARAHKRLTGTAPTF